MTMTQCDQCGRTHVRCTHCGNEFDIGSKRDRIIDVLNYTRGMHGTRIAELVGEPVSSVYDELTRMVAEGDAKHLGGRKGFVKVFNPLAGQLQPQPLTIAA
jgi:hypothetical protein